MRTPERSRRKGEDYFITIMDPKNSLMYSAFLRGSEIVLEKTDTATGRREEVDYFPSARGYAANCMEVVVRLQYMTGRPIRNKILS